MKKQSAVLLDDPAKPKKYTIRMRLQEGKTVLMEFNSKDVAEQQYDFYRAFGVIANVVIKEITLEISTI